MASAQSRCCPARASILTGLYPHQTGIGNMTSAKPATDNPGYTGAGIISTIAGSGAKEYSGDGGPATSASFSEPAGLAVDGDGTIYVADVYNNVVRVLRIVGN